MQKIIILGGGGHAKVLIDLIRTLNQYEIAGILDPQLEIRSAFVGIPVLGSDDLLPKLYADGIKNTCIAVGSIKADNKRKILFEKAKRIGFTVPSLVHPQAIISENAEINRGAQIMAGAIIQTGSSIGENVVIYSGAIIEHDCQVKSHSHICPGATLSGGCVVGENSFIGAGATVIQGIVIGSDVTVGAGSVVIKDVPDGVTIKGVPAKGE